jgi:hypothetical protein
MKKTVKVIMRPANVSNRLLHLLRNNQFEIWSYNPTTSEYVKYSKKIRLFDSDEYQLVAIYNGTSWPSQEVFTAIDSHPSVSCFAIDKRVD